jgi:hypothetical protein
MIKLLNKIKKQERLLEKNKWFEFMKGQKNE